MTLATSNNTVSTQTESTLNMSMLDVRAEVAFYLGWGRDDTALSDSQKSDLKSVIDSGCRNFYWPAPVSGRIHSWTFLKPTATLTTYASYATGTASCTLSSTTVTFSTGVAVPAWAVGMTISLPDGAYTIASIDTSSQITLTEAYAGTTDGTADYSIDHSGDYELPATFGVVLGDIVLVSDTWDEPITIVNEGRIRALRVADDTAEKPRFAAIRPKAKESKSPQRFELMLYPRPDAEYDVTYKYSVLPEALSDPDNLYSLGGAAHAETLLESCLAIAEQRLNDEASLHTSKFQERLAASIAYDLQNTPHYFGYNGDGYDLTDRRTRTVLTTYQGRTW